MAEVLNEMPDTVLGGNQAKDAAAKGLGPGPVSVLLPRGGSWSSMSTFESASLPMDQVYGSGSVSPIPNKTARSSGDESDLPLLGMPVAPAASPAVSAVEAPTRPAHRFSSVMHRVASTAVTLYDLVLRMVMVSYYVIGLDTFTSGQDYLAARAAKKTRRFVESASRKFESALASGALRVEVRAGGFDAAGMAFATSMLRGHHGMPYPVFLVWRGLAWLLSLSLAASFTSVVDSASGAIVGVFMEFRQGADVHHFITALVDPAASRKYGIYVAKYGEMISECVRAGISILRLGPTTDELKRGLGGVRLPMLVVGSAVWGRLEGRCSVVAFGLFTSVGLLVWVAVAQWCLDAAGIGAMTLGELSVLYFACIACVKLLPLWSIGLRKIVSDPRKYLVQTSFYAQGIVPGAALGVWAVSHGRGTHPLALLDGLALFLLVGEVIGRLGCHFYGCCFGALATAGDPGADFPRWSVVYVNRTAAVARLRPEFMLRPLLPTQVLQSAFAAGSQLAVLAGLSALGTVPVGWVCASVLSLYSVGRLIFFTLREDENFKSNRSYTTAYMALATIAGSAALAAAGWWGGETSPVSLAVLGSAAAAGAVPAAAIAQHVLLAATIAGANFALQGLHHHERVGQFPDPAALFALPGARAGSKGLGRSQVWSSWAGPEAAQTGAEDVFENTWTAATKDG